MAMKRFSFPSFFVGLAAGLLLLVALLAGCAVSTSSDAMNDEPLDEYASTLKKVTAGRSGGPTEAEKRGLEAWKGLLADLSVENVEGKASQVYAEETFFNDTLKTLRSNEAIEDYLIETAEMLHEGTVEYRDTQRADDGSYYVRWQMVYKGKKLAGGKPIRTIGMSHLVFDGEGRVVLHQDFWDSTRGIFQHIPVVGGQVRFIKNRL